MPVITVVATAAVEESKNSGVSGDGLWMSLALSMGGFTALRLSGIGIVG
jgi:hypothetical protein